MDKTAPTGPVRCRACGRASLDDPSPVGYSEAEKEQILRAYEERSSLRGLARTSGASRNTVTAWLKKALSLPPLKETLLEPAQPERVGLELDELSSFVRHEGNKRWVWLALCRATRQAVTCVVGGHGEATCRHPVANGPC